MFGVSSGELDVDDGEVFALGFGWVEVPFCVTQSLLQHSRAFLWLSG